MMIFLFWVGLAVVVAVFADRRHRSPLGWFFLACAISPILAGLLLVVMKPLKDPDSKDCPGCAEPVKREAMVCKHCGHEFPAEEVLQQILDAGSEVAKRKADQRRTMGIVAASIGLMIAIVYIGGDLQERSDRAGQTYEAAEVCQAVRLQVIENLSYQRARINGRECSELTVNSEDSKRWNVTGRVYVNDAPLMFSAMVTPPGFFFSEWRTCDLRYLGNEELTARAPRC